MFTFLDCIQRMLKSYLSGARVEVLIDYSVLYGGLRTLSHTFTHFHPTSSSLDFIHLISMFPRALQVRTHLSNPIILKKPLASRSIYRSPQAKHSSTLRNYVSGQPRTPTTEPLKVWPFVFITLAGSASYMWMVKSRVETNGPAKPRGPSITPQ